MKKDKETSTLLIIGGPSCSGKTFLINKIRQGLYPDLCNKIGLQNHSTWRFVNANELEFLDLSTEKKLVVHYDFFFQHSEWNAFYLIDALAEHFDVVNAVTLTVPTKTLVKRNNYRIIKHVIKYCMTLLRFGKRERR